MPSQKPKVIDSPNALVAILKNASTQIVEKLVNNEEAIEEKEFQAALVIVFCEYVEQGESPPLPIQKYIGGVLQKALKGELPKGDFQKSDRIGRRNFWLSSTAWRLRTDGHRAMDAYRHTMDRWNKKVAKHRSRKASERILFQASRQFSWLDESRPKLEEFIIGPGGINLADSVVGHDLEFGGRVSVKVPTACQVEVPREGEVPSDLEHAKSLCRSFCIGVKKPNKGVLLPGLLPYFARSFRLALGGIPVARVLCLVRDRSGRPTRGGAPDGWPDRKSSQDARDLWLAEEVFLQLEKSLHDQNQRMTTKACRIVAEKWAKENPRRKLGKDTVRAAWNRWGDYVRWIVPARRFQEERRRERENIALQIKSMSPLNEKLWEQMIIHAEGDGILQGKALQAISKQMQNFKNFNLDTMLADLNSQNLIEIRRDNGTTVVKIIDFHDRSSDLGIGQIIEGDRNGNYYMEWADKNFPIFQTGPES